MSTYVIGDIHGCFQTLQNLLERIGFIAGQDRLWLVGDLVNRGPRSLEVLRWVREREDQVLAVLGNHDLHLLACAFEVASPKEKDSLKAVLQADDKEELLEWLRRRPLIHHESERLLVHAGLLPQWGLEQALALGREVEDALQGPQLTTVLQSLYWKTVPVWGETLTGTTRLGCALNGFTRLRTCNSDGSMRVDFTGPLWETPPGCFPWFSFPARKPCSSTVYFGHWAALGFYQAPGVMALDTNCVRGGELTAVRLEDGTLFQEPSADLSPVTPDRE
ncbi:MAG: diadenosine tetraphosphatase [Acidobacteria bacterium]|nr:MAG: diadenosine tetraphosphatase [Acidobacteriota bacterium]